MMTTQSVFFSRPTRVMRVAAFLLFAFALAAARPAAADPLLLPESGGIVVMPDGTMAQEQDIAGDILAAETDDLSPTEAVVNEAAAHPDAGAIGFPQLDTSTYSSQVFWLIISFALMYLLMSRLALPRIAEVVDLRQTQTNVKLDRAAQLNEDAKKLQEEFQVFLAQAQENARVTLHAAEQKAAQAATAADQAFTAMARARVAQAEDNIAQAKRKALDSLADIAAETAVEMARKVAHVQVDKDEARKTVQKLIAI